MPVKDPAALLKRLLNEPQESPWLEFKHNNGDPDAIGECVSASANGAMLAGKERAFIVFGIENRTKKRLGTSVRLIDIRKGGENLDNWLNRMIEPRLLIELLDFEDGGKHFSIVVLEPTYDRPVRFSGTEFIRIGENIKKLKDFPAQERALWLATNRHKFESAVAATHQTQEQVLELLDVNGYYALTKEEMPTNPAEVIRKISALGFIKDDMEGGYDILNLGALLIAKDLTQFPSVSGKSVRVIRYIGRDKTKSESETEGRKGYALGFSPMIQFVQNRVPSEEKYVDGIREKVPLLPPVAIREIVANALIHQDFTVTGAGPVIEIYDDRIEVTNPGNSLIEVDRIIDERRSRNEKLAEIMRGLGICEERGGGIDKAIVELEIRSLPAPEFFPSKDSMRVVIFGPRRFGQLSKADRVWACFCHCVIRWLRHEHMNNTSLRERFSLSPKDYQVVSAVIADAKKAKKIVPADADQGRRHAKYVPYWVR